MEETMICPACGGPLAISQDQTEVSCGFCGADYQIVRQDGHTELVLQSQPGPQKESLTRQSDDALKTVIEESSVRASDLREQAADPDVPPLELFDETPAMPEAYTNTGAHMYNATDELVGMADGPAERPVTGPAVQPVTNTSTNIYTQAIPEERAVSDNRWLPISLAVFAVVCLLCACMGGIFMMFSMARGSGF